MNVLIFYKTCSKTAFLKRKKESSSTILLFSLQLHLSSLLVKCVKDMAYKSSHNNFYQKERFNLYVFNVIYSMI